MAMPQRDKVIEEIKRLDALLEYAVLSFPHLYKSGNRATKPKPNGYARN